MSFPRILLVALLGQATIAASRADDATDLGGSPPGSPEALVRVTGLSQEYCPEAEAISFLAENISGDVVSSSFGVEWRDDSGQWQEYATDVLGAEPFPKQVLAFRFSSAGTLALSWRPWVTNDARRLREGAYRIVATALVDDRPPARRTVVAEFAVRRGDGCPNPSSTPQACGAAVFHPWSWEGRENAARQLKAFRNVLVVRVDSFRSEPSAPGRLTPYLLDGTVVRSYQGRWRVQERIHLVQHGDAPAGPVPERAGELVFVFTNEHTAKQIRVDGGELGNFTNEMVPALECLFPRHRRPRP